MKKIYNFLPVILLLACSIFDCGKVAAQGVGINITGAAADNSAILDASSSSAGALIPRMTYANRTSISSPASSLIVYQTDAPTGYPAGYYFNAGTSGTPNWIFLTNSTQVQTNALGYAADGGSANTYTITLSPAPTAYTTGMIVSFKAANINSGGASTLSVNGLTAKPVTKQAGTALAAGDIQAGQIVTAIYDGASFQMISQLGQAAASGDAPCYTCDGY